MWYMFLYTTDYIVEFMFTFGRGPMGLEELTCSKWIVFGQGQVRE